MARITGPNVALWISLLGSSMVAGVWTLTHFYDVEFSAAGKGVWKGAVATRGGIYFCRYGGYLGQAFPLDFCYSRTWRTRTRQEMAWQLLGCYGERPRWGVGCDSDWEFRFAGLEMGTGKWRPPFTWRHPRMSYLIVQIPYWAIFVAAWCVPWGAVLAGRWVGRERKHAAPTAGPVG